MNTELPARHWVMAVVALASLAVVCGGFDLHGGVIWLGVLATAGLSVALGVDARWRLEGQDPPAARPMSALEGPLLWIVSAWALTRLGGELGGYLFIAPAAVLAALVAMFPPAVRGPAVGLAVALELGLLLTSRLDWLEVMIRAGVLVAAVWALTRLARWAAWRADMSAARAARAAASEVHDSKRDFGLLTGQTPAISGLPAEELADRPTVGQYALDQVQQSFSLQVQLLRAALDATTVAVLWRGPESTVRLRAYDSARDDLIVGPYTDAAGIPGSVLRDGEPVAVTPVHPGGLPYYPQDADRDDEAPNGVLAVPVLDAAGEVAGVLCIDGPRPIDHTTRRIAHYGADSLALAVRMGRQLKATDLERTVVQRICGALQALNRSLGLDEAADATVKAVKGLVKPDLVALSIVRGDEHVIVRAEGEGAEALANLNFTGDEGLVGQAVRLGQVLPVSGGGRRQGVFTASDTLPNMQSLLVLPLRKVDGSPIGALTVASRAPDRFVAHRREMLQLVTEQMGITLDLAQAHERLRNLASTDGLTGLSNHRTFQQGLSNMIDRARRRESSLCLLIVDLDNFKALNDAHGHPFGDAVLRSVAVCVQRLSRTVDLVARYGGEEFAVVLEDSDLDGACLMAERIRAGIEALRFEVDGATVRASVGLTQWPKDAETQAQLIDQADKALYEAKRLGRNQVCTWRSLQDAQPRPSAEE